MKTWRQLEAMAKRQGLVIRRSCVHDAVLDENDDRGMMSRRRLAVAVSHGIGTRTSDRILRAMVEAALKEGR